MESFIKSNLERTLERIGAAAIRSGRGAADITLVAATKSQSLEVISSFENICNSIQIKTICAENYAQELASKAPHFPQIDWHFIGRLQRNKSDLVIEHCSLVQSVGSEKLLQALEWHASKRQKTFRILLQVNISDDPAKDGFSSQSTKNLGDVLSKISHLKVAGVMTILEQGLSRDDAKRCYERLTRLTDELLNLKIISSDTEAKPIISMGMSDDFDAAIEAGATMVRVGTAIFGHRPTITY